jgi:hypothetical protein
MTLIGMEYTCIRSVKSTSDIGQHLPADRRFKEVHTKFAHQICTQQQWLLLLFLVLVLVLVLVLFHTILFVLVNIMLTETEYAAMCEHVSAGRSGHMDLPVIFQHYIIGPCCCYIFLVNMNISTFWLAGIV